MRAGGEEKKKKKDAPAKKDKFRRSPGPAGAADAKGGAAGKDAKGAPAKAESRMARGPSPKDELDPKGMLDTSTSNDFQMHHTLSTVQIKQVEQLIDSKLYKH